MPRDISIFAVIGQVDVGVNATAHAMRGSTRGGHLLLFSYGADQITCCATSTFSVHPIARDMAVFRNSSLPSKSTTTWLMIDVRVVPLLQAILLAMKDG